jgi:hypothetical protein
MRNAASRGGTVLAPVPVDAEAKPDARYWRVGRAYRAGRLVCGCVHVSIRLHDRLGLTGRERCMVRVRFCEPLADDLRAELGELAHRRGTASERAAERIAPIELVIDDPAGERERITGRLRPPHRHHGRLRDIEFGFGRLT